MGRDEHKTGSRSTNSLPQTPKNSKITPDTVNEEYARELAELAILRQKRMQRNQQPKK
ncbi:YfhD family protein [Domibacillus antri]|uniref:YfhD family protein n=1 Tax=Domibacillus antri TaxID=1714264 RepID=UPI000B067DBC|nr:YfhD family protein [Domibacillus antri]